MKDPLDTERDATEWLALISLWLGSIALGIVFLLACAGLVGLAVGLMLRAARWVAG